MSSADEIMKEPSFPQPESYPERGKRSVHTEGKSNLIESNPRLFLEQEIIAPLLRLHPTSFTKNPLVYRGERSDAQLAQFNTSFNEEFGGGAISERYEMRHRDGDPWLAFSTQQNKQDHKNELRCYVFAKCESVPKVAKALLDGLEKFPSFYYLKINYTSEERLDNIVAYFSEDATQKEVSALLGILERLQEQASPSDMPLFGEWDIPTPFGEKILSPDTTGTSVDKPIGSISYFPLRSSSQKMRFEDLQEPNGVIRKGYGGRTPHSLMSSLHSILTRKATNGLDLKTLTQFTSDLRISVTGSGESATHWRLIDLMRLCKNEVDKRIQR